MANTKSARKRARQNDKRRERNRGVRTNVKSLVKTAVDGIAKAANRADALKFLIAGERALQKAVSKGVLPKERASRKTSRMASAVDARFKA